MGSVAGATIANAWVQIDPSFDGLARKLKTGLEGPVEKAGRDAGEKAGKAVGDGLERQAKQAGAKAGDAIGSGIEGKLRGGSGIARMAAAVGFGALVNNAKNAASDLQQAIGATESVFGESASKIDEWAKGAADALGLSERSARESLNLIGSQFKNFGFSMDDAMSKGQDLVELGADLAATFGGSTADAVRALSAVFRGEFDSIEKYGVSLRQSEVAQRAVSMGLAKSTTQVSRHAQAQATMAMILEQTADAQGQFAREADTAAGAQARAAAKAENAAAAMGDALLPVYAKVTEVVGTVAEAFSKLPGPVQTGVVALAGIAALSGPLSGLSGIIGGIGRAAKGLSGLSMLSKVGLGLGAATLAVGAGFAIWDRFQRKQRELEANTRAVADALPAQVTETWRLAEASAGATGTIDGLRVAQEALSATLADNGDMGKRLTQAMGALGLQTKDALTVLSSITDDPIAGMMELGESMGLSTTNAYLLAEALDRTDGSLDDLRQEFMYAATELAGGALPENMLLTEDAAAALWEELGPLADAMGDLEGVAKAIDLDDLAQQFLNASAAGSQAAADLVADAKASALAADSTATALDVYLEYNRLLATMTPAQRALVVGMKDAATATDDLAGGLQKLEMREVASSFDRAADAASGFSSALDKVIGPSMDLEESSRRIRDNAADLAAAFAENGASLDINTEAGRKNREEVQKSAQGLLDHAEAMIADGASIEEATAFVSWSTGALVAQAKQAGVSEAEMRDYLATLGMTPAQVSTAIQLMNDEAAKRRVNELIGRLDAIPDPVRSEIQALIDTGQLALAEARLRDLARPRTAVIHVTSSGTVQVAKRYTAQYSAHGNIFDTPTLSVFGEAGAEAILPLTRPTDMSRIVNDPQVRGPVLSALGARPSGGGGGGLVWNQNAPVYGVDDLRATIAEAWRALQRKQLAGSRFA